MKKINIAIDGHSGCGKSSTAIVIAKKLGYKYIDTGAMYRAVTWALLSTNTDIKSELKLTSLLDQITIDFHNDTLNNQNEIILNGEKIEDKIRSMKVAEKVSEVSAHKLVRARMLELQRQMASEKGVVMDGRDIGTVVLPDAELKIFMTADAHVRAERRKEELINKGMTTISHEEVLNNLLNRDKSDMTRKISPLKQASDAILIDTTYLTFDQQVEKILKLARGKISTEQVN
ncbi:MAG: (d)CMP kinase [Cyclobacteriaceae bacterium]|nr:(d)CMP kinase [Cyclobacteriaceae bacterium]